MLRLGTWPDRRRGLRLLRLLRGEREFPSFRGGLYRSRNGRFLGVCRGVADYFDMPVFWVRAMTVMFILFTGLWPGVAVYFLAAFLMKLEPVVQPQSSSEREFYNSYARSRSDAVGRIKEKFERLDKRLRRMEDVVTSKDWQWERRMGE